MGLGSISLGVLASVLALAGVSRRRHALPSGTRVAALLTVRRAVTHGLASVCTEVSAATPLSSHSR